MAGGDREILDIELPRGWTLTLGARGSEVRFHAVYSASCGGLLHVRLTAGELTYEAEELRAVEEAVTAARTLLADLRAGTLAGTVRCRQDGRFRRRQRRP